MSPGARIISEIRKTDALDGENFLRGGAYLTSITERCRYVSDLTKASSQSNAEQRIPHLGCSVSIRIDDYKCPQIGIP